MADKAVKEAEEIKEETPETEEVLQENEAEAGTEDIKGRVLVANVILNRLKTS